MITASEPQSSEIDRAPGHAARRRGTIGLWAALLLLIGLVALVAAEVAGRIYYRSRYPVSSSVTAADLVYGYYPELKQAKEPARDLHPRVLLVGGSVMNQTFGNVQSQLREALKKAWQQDVHVFNVAMLGHSSLDSYYKYREVRDQPFDLVIVYDSINDLRPNNVRPDLWRDDYGHYSWYDEINFYFRHPALRRLPVIFPYFLKHATVEIDRALIHRDRYVPEHAPRPDSVVYGAEIKSAPVFRRNLEDIVTLAAVKRDPLMLMTFAYYLPSNYSYDRFLRHELGYSREAVSSPSAVEIWGAPDHVLKGLEVHNRVIRELHAAHPDTLFADQAGRMGDPGDFVDVCHLSPAGTSRFVEGIMEVVRSRAIVPRSRGS